MPVAADIIAAVDLHSPVCSAPEGHQWNVHQFLQALYPALPVSSRLNNYVKLLCSDLSRYGAYSANKTKQKQL